MGTSVRPQIIHCVTHVNFTDSDPARATTKICMILRKKKMVFGICHVLHSGGSNRTSSFTIYSKGEKEFSFSFSFGEQRIWSAPGASPRSNGAISTSVPATVIPQFF
uniref:Uncharacterized protein n=1 Tax=Trichogramma kaykai TaxID=54128 RepID=A0ABD2WCB3_9HYME